MSGNGNGNPPQLFTLAYCVRAGPHDSRTATNRAVVNPLRGAVKGNEGARRGGQRTEAAWVFD
eukprot:7723382-Alexandrium_andersonii.AAC.1